MCECLSQGSLSGFVVSWPIFSRCGLTNHIPNVRHRTATQGQEMLHNDTFRG